MNNDNFQAITDQLNRIEQMTLLSSKDVLTRSEASLFTGLSESNIYKLTSEKKIPHYKPRGGKIYFSKKELSEWLLQNRISTTDEIDAIATTYVTTKRKRK